MAPGSPFGPNLRALALHLRFSQTSASTGSGGVPRRLRAQDQRGRARQDDARRRCPLRRPGRAARRAAAREPGARLRRDRAQGGGAQLLASGCCTTATARCSGPPPAAASGSWRTCSTGTAPTSGSPTAMAGRRASRPAATLLPRASDPRRVVTRWTPAMLASPPASSGCSGAPAASAPSATGSATASSRPTTAGSSGS